ncbi:MAG: hypothetical protein Aurels2KO_03620 [Aureliella sp.]
MMRLSICCLAILLIVAGSRISGGQTRPEVLKKLPAGTSAEPDSSDIFNRVILLARPKISSGDTDALPKSIQSAVSSFVLTIMAQVDKQPSGKFELATVGAGYSTPVDGVLRVVTPDAAADVGARLGFVQRQMLSQNTTQIEAIPVVAQNKQLLVFDTPSLLLRDGKHVDFTMRHFVFVDSDNGKTATLVWLLGSEPIADASGVKSYRVVDEPLRWLPPGLKESREIHVDGKEFSLLGIPTKRAFALEDLPPGRQLQWTNEGRQVAGLTRYTTEQLRSLASALSASLAAGKQASR